MNELEAQVRCLEAALVQAKAENSHGNVDRVVDLQKKFYTLVSGAPASEETIPSQEPTKKPESVSKKQGDKVPDIFEAPPAKR